MNSLKIYDKQERLVFNKNKHFCFIYKYELDCNITYSINISEKKSKFQSIFECIVTKKDEEIAISLSDNHLEYSIKTQDGEVEILDKGRIPIDVNKKKWSNKSLSLNNKKLIGIDSFDGINSLVYEIKNEILEQLIYINNGK